ncbi:hypothetical protein [Undibacterium sp. TC9W]|uniref:hypothetical protein n=1 Tax=Undibacterium sp. TC9W TaxID=3413053 RepID=UPI003BF24F8F
MHINDDSKGTYMADTSFVPAIAALLGVALAQGVAMFQGWLDRKHKRRILLREKYEEFALIFLESRKQSVKLYNCASSAEILEIMLLDDANKALLIAKLYFPELCEPVKRYIDSFSILIQLTNNSYVSCGTSAILAATTGYLQTESKKIKYAEAGKAYGDASDFLNDEIVRNSSTYTQN